MLTEEFGALSAVFVQRQLDALAEHRPFVGCWVRSNREQFPHEPVHLLRLERSSDRWLGALERLLPGRYRMAAAREAGSALERLLERYRPRLLYIHFGWTAARVVHVLERCGVPYTLVIHGSDLNSALRHPSHPYARRLRRALRAAHGCWFASRDLREKAIAFGCPPEKAEVFYLGVPIPAGRADPLRSGPLRIAVIGRLVPVKGHEVLLEAFARVAREIPGAELRIIGDGPLRAALEQRSTALGIASRTAFLGGLPSERCFAELQGAQLYVQPSVRLPSGEEEGLGLAIQEAMSCALPVVATRSGGIPESVLDQETGLLVPPGDPGELAQAILHLLKDPAARVRLGEAGRRRAESTFSLEQRNADLRERMRAWLAT